MSPSVNTLSDVATFERLLSHCVESVGQKAQYYFSDTEIDTLSRREYLFFTSETRDTSRTIDSGTFPTKGVTRVVLFPSPWGLGRTCRTSDTCLTTQPPHIRPLSLGSHRTPVILRSNFIC